MSGPSDAQKTVEAFRGRMNTLDDRLASSMMRSYAPVYKQLTKEMEDLVRKGAARNLKPWEIMRSKRLKDIERQFLSRMDEFAIAGGDLITNGQRTAVGLARSGAGETVASALPNGVTMDNLANIGLEWNRLPDDAFSNFIGMAADGKPVGRLLEPLGPAAAKEVRGAIGTGIAMGKGPRATARLIETAAGMPLTRALLITRTETNRAFREASRLEYASSPVVKGYRRMAAKTERTCMACIALDGTLYDLNEPLNEHPNGRCTMVPEVLDYADLGLDVPRQAPPEDARDWLGRQNERVQRKILGDTRLKAWKQGEIQLNQLATVRTSKVWGDAAVIRPVKDLGLGKGGPGGVAPPKPPPRPRRTRRPRKAAPEVTVPEPLPLPDELIDPKTGEKIRGTRTTPPEPRLPRGWEGDPEDFFDVVPDADALRFDPRYRGNVPVQMSGYVREQEAWARAVGGVIEADYQGMSIRAAQQANKGIEATIVRNRWRPLDKITTKALPEEPFSSGTYAYQGGNSVHINPVSASIGPYQPGTARGWTRKILADNEMAVTDVQAAGKAIARLGPEIEQMKKDLAEHISKFGGSGRLPETVRGVPTGRTLNVPEYKSYIQNLEDAIATHEATLATKAAQRFHPTLGEEGLKEIVTHEIGHYAHRRWSFSESRGVNLLYPGNQTAIQKAAREHAANISEYALKNELEHFAEAFNEHVWLGGARNSKEVTAFIEDVMKVNTDFAGIDSFNLHQLAGKKK